MGAVVSCIKSIFRVIGDALVAIARAIASILYAIIDGILALFDIIVSCLTCRGFGSRGWKYRRGRRTGGRHHTSVV